MKESQLQEIIVVASPMPLHTRKRRLFREEEKKLQILTKALKTRFRGKRVLVVAEESHPGRTCAAPIAKKLRVKPEPLPERSLHTVLDAASFLQTLPARNADAAIVVFGRSWISNALELFSAKQFGLQGGLGVSWDIENCDAVRVDLAQKTIEVFVP